MLIRIGVFLLHTDIKDYKDVGFGHFKPARMLAIV